MTTPPKPKKRKPAEAAPCGSFYWPLWKHMADNHSLTLLDSECEDIIQVASKILKRVSRIRKFR